jgi:hypothetical protein
VKVSAGSCPRSAANTRIARFIAARRQVLGLLSCPSMEASSRLPPWAAMNVSLCRNKPPDTHRGIDPTLVRCQLGHLRCHPMRRRIGLTALLAFGPGELGQEGFVHLPHHEMLVVLPIHLGAQLSALAHSTALKSLPLASAVVTEAEPVHGVCT